MDYTIHRFVNGRWAGEETVRERPSDWVCEHAKAIVEAREADHVEVVDQRNVCVFRWPRVLHRT